MTQDQHNNPLNSLYKNFIEKAKKFLETKYPLSVCNPNEEEILEISNNLPKDFKPFEFWKLELEGSLQKFTFIVAIPHTFPDLFPKIYLSKEDYRKIYPVPHIDKNRFVCTRDPEVTAINDRKVDEAIEELLKIAIGIIESGIRGENKNDFFEEFLAYWNDNADYNKLLSLFNPTDKVSYLKILKLSDKIFNADHIVTDSEDSVEHWLTPLNIKLDKNKEIEALYLPLSEIPSSFFDGKQNPLLILKNLNNRGYVKAVEKFFNEDNKYNIIIASVPIRGEKVLFGWDYPRWPNIKGFRRKKVPLNIRLSHVKNNLIEKLRIERLDKKRILKRGGTESSLIKIDFSIALIGCGSLGGYLAMSLARCGISKYLLVDKEVLEPENVARHLCGFLEASESMKKVDAVKKRVTEHFPHIECETYYGDVLNLIKESGIEKLGNYDLVIMAIGNMAIERRINYLMRKNVIKSPVVYLWIEPFATGGQLLYITSRNGGCFECCFNEKGEFRYSIVPQNQMLSRREPGCQSTYTPYTSLDVEHFISIASKKILNIIEKKTDHSKLFTWLGDLEICRKLGYQINDMYVTDSSYDVIEKEIFPNQCCGLCEDR